jgi:hypothetical protein
MHNPEKPEPYRRSQKGKSARKGAETQRNFLCEPLRLCVKVFAFFTKI